MVFYFIFTPGEIVAAAVLLPLVGAVLVAARIWARLQKVKKLGIEDWLVLPALAFLVGMGIASIYGVAKKAEGYRLPEEDQDPAHLRTADQVFWNTEWMQPLALGCIKLSFLFFYRRVFNVGPNSSAFNVISIASIILIIIWMIGFALAVLLICPGHVAKYWVETDERARYCWNTGKFLYALCWSDVGTDLMVLLLPIPSVSRLHMPTRKKFALVAIFALGGLTILASITRGVLFAQLLHTEKIAKESELASLDPNMINTNGIYWMLLETGLALIAVNLPLLYGVAARDGVGSIVRFARSITSLRSQGSRQGHTSLASSVHKSSTEFHENGNNIELVPGMQHTSSSKITHTEPVDRVGLQIGDINVTRSYSVDPPV